MLSFLTIGDWDSSQVSVARGADSRPRIDDVEQHIEQTWTAALRTPGVKLFDGPMCRLESWQASAESLRLVLSPTTYKAFFGTNLGHAQLADRYGRAALANPVGLSAALVTADDHLMLGRRNASVAYYPNRTHPFAGSLEPADNDDLFAAIRRELAEELSFGPSDIAEVRCCGIVEDHALRQPEVIFRVRSTLTRAEVQARVDATEHHASWSTPAGAAEVEQAMKDTTLTPVAVGALLLWGRARFGDGWFEAARVSVGV